MAEQQPKVALINRKLAQRFVILLFVIALLVAAIQLFRTYGGDPAELATADTAGWVAAVEVKGDGQQAVLIKPDGTIVRSPDYREGATDRDLAWRPNGNHLFFVSDRVEDVYHAFRWAIGANVVERRTTAKLSRSALAFLPSHVEGSSKNLLLVRGGMVFELDPASGAEIRVVPRPENQRSGGDEEQMAEEGLATELRFKRARWTPDRGWIVGVRRTETGEALVLQNMTPNEQGLLPPLVTVAAGQKVEFDVNPRTGEVVFTAQSFQFPDLRRVPPEFVKDGRVTRPFHHWIGMVDPNRPERSVPPIAISPDDKLAFGNPVVSPDGSTVAVVVGAYQDSSLTPEQLVVMPAAEGGGQQRTLVLAGRISQVSWHPNSRTLVFIRPDAQGKRSVFTIDRDGSGERNLTGGQGDFREPLFSPQSK
ncbi:MAG TPA: hypothetical protein VM328_06305 [Fimbriimonadaceae bacterium]|nr:hypothetical protein [Fimbriimonadaceae bacterium]